LNVGAAEDVADRDHPVVVQVAAEEVLMPEALSL